MVILISLIFFAIKVVLFLSLILFVFGIAFFLLILPSVRSALFIGQTVCIIISVEYLNKAFQLSFSNIL